MRFSWKALLIAPVLMPLLFSATLVVAALFGDHPGSTPGSALGSAALLFLVLTIVGCIISYGITVCVFLPCLYLLSWRRAPGYAGVCLLGLVLGAAAVVPVTWAEWNSSGPDSGPPVESFSTFFLRWASDPSFALNLIFPLSGLITAGLYWWLAAWPGSRARQTG